MKKEKGQAKVVRGTQRKRRESDIFLTKLNSMFSSIVDFQEGKISSFESILWSIKDAQDLLRKKEEDIGSLSLGRRQEDLSLKGSILAHLQRIILNLPRV